jgi:hypothetical protein
VAFWIVLVLQLFCQYVGSYNFGPAQIRSRMSGVVQRQARVLGALEKYRQSHSAYPTSLDQLVPGQLPAIPASYEGAGFPLHYAVLDDRSTSDTSVCLVWFAGPDRKYDVQDGPELKTAMQALAGGESSPWLAGLAYDPTNGSRSRGDIYRSSAIPPSIVSAKNAK